MNPEEALTRPLAFTRHSHTLKVDGRTFNSLKRLADYYGLSYATVCWRWKRGWPNRHIVFGKPKKRKLTFRGRTYLNQSELCAAHGVKFSTFRKRLDNSWSLEQALGVHDRKDLRGGASSNTGGTPVVVAGVSYPSKSACSRAFGLKPHMVGDRLGRGWTVEQAVGIDPSPHAEKRTPVTVAGRKFRSQQAAAEHYDVPINTYRWRRNAGWTVDKALGLCE